MKRDRFSDIGPYTIVPEWIIESGVSDGAVVLFVALGLRANREGTCFPSRKFLADQLSVSEDTIDRRIKELVEAEAIQVEPRYSKKNEHERTSNLYRLRFAAPD